MTEEERVKREKADTIQSVSRDTPDKILEGKDVEGKDLEGNRETR